ncbi:hypothetical protein [Bacillus solimangrovi]|uniref:Uncharacterized protein n=1 Tax=Bacillus solimangrovi TaxID=1305675 RepID=A0A1E5LCA2_9BACI|nr:hypothetical protein [Bacillus solimangrovi]OEH91691.1 hypothetical protein BFG57_18085 [Bacillus solimangrovi]
MGKIDKIDLFFSIILVMNMLIVIVMLFRIDDSGLWVASSGLFLGFSSLFVAMTYRIVDKDKNNRQQIKLDERLAKIEELLSTINKENDSAVLKQLEEIKSMFNIENKLERNQFSLITINTNEKDSNNIE